MGLRDIPFWGRVAGELLDAGMDRMGAKKCATKGHNWRDVGAIVLREDGGVDQLPRGTMQRCRRCGETRAKPA
ncbi:MAG TPA: hypothetical protein VF812_15655 [Ktedonobacterales bacterium]